MQRYIAFLRAINVGGRNVKMEVLRDIFTQLGLHQVETFIASGNVIFASPESSSQLTPRIEAALNAELGYPVATFLRTPQALQEIVAYQAFSAAQRQSAQALNIAFLDAPLRPEQNSALHSLQTDIDSLSHHGQEIYWLCANKQSDSKLSNAVFEKKLGARMTLRGHSTLQKLVTKLAD